MSIIILEHFIIYWGLSLFLFFFDTIFQKDWDKFKLGKLVIPDKISNIVLIVLTNQILSMPLFYFFNNFSPDVSNIKFLPLTFLIEEVLFYSIHLILHRPYFYDKIHKIHHRWNSPMAISTFYCHPLEHIFCNVLPILVSARLSGLGETGMRIWHAIVMVNTILLAHGGYKLPTKNMHYRHHAEFNCNYGALGILDYLCGTLR
jgi:sterol desaturase/sphingolipid hydroxylase (fatty acid hydroxylase superfamily)